MSNNSEPRVCSECSEEKPTYNFAWTYDRYGNPWRKVCGSCFDSVSEEIDKWVFDAGDAGEDLVDDFCTL